MADTSKENEPKIPDPLKVKPQKGGSSIQVLRGFFMILVTVGVVATTATKTYYKMRSLKMAQATSENVPHSSTEENQSFHPKCTEMWVKDTLKVSVSQTFPGYEGEVEIRQYNSTYKTLVKGDNGWEEFDLRYDKVLPSKWRNGFYLVTKTPAKIALCRH